MLDFCVRVQDTTLILGIFGGVDLESAAEHWLWHCRKEQAGGQRLGQARRGLGARD